MDLKKYFIFIIVCMLLSKQKRLSNKQKKIVNLAFATNNNGVKLLYISLFSLLENSNNNTIYNIYIQVKNNFEKELKVLLHNLEKIYFNCFLHFINMKREFINAFRNHLDISTYYRIKLPILCSNINRIVHIDADTLILKDLLELYTLNFEQKFILGRLDGITDELDKLGVITKNYINAGIILMDLYSFRKYNYDKKFMNYINNHNNYRYLWHHAQTTINFICHDKIGLLKPRYHMWPFISKKDLIDLNNLFRIKYNETEFLNDYDNPFIVHYPGVYKDFTKNSTYNRLYKEYLAKIKGNEIEQVIKNTLYVINCLSFGIFILIKLIIIYRKYFYKKRYIEKKYCF